MVLRARRSTLLAVTVIVISVGIAADHLRGSRESQGLPSGEPPPPLSPSRASGERRRVVVPSPTSDYPTAREQAKGTVRPESSRPDMRSASARFVPPATIEAPAEQLAELEYVNARREHMFEQLELAWEGEKERDEDSRKEQQSVIAQLERFGDATGVKVSCRTTVCKISVPVTSPELGAAAELELKIPDGLDNIIKVIGDPSRGFIERVDIYRLTRERLQEIIGDNADEALRPPSMRYAEMDP